MTALIWVHDSAKIWAKIQNLIVDIEKHNTRVIILTLHNNTAKFIRLKGHKEVNSLEKIIKHLHPKLSSKNELLHKQDIFNRKSTLGFVNDVMKAKGLYLKKFDNNLVHTFEDEINILRNIIKNIVRQEKIKRLFILNGMSSVAFTLADYAFNNHIDHCFFENGLIDGSLFIDKIGVNSYSSLALKKKISLLPNNNIHNQNDETERRISLFNGSLSAGLNVLVALQVDHDTNIICAAGFKSSIDFIINFIIPISIKFPKSIFRLRSHPKNNQEKFLRKISQAYKNIKFEDPNVLGISESLKNTNLVITQNSTVGVESLIKKIPLISTGKSSYSDYMSFINSKEVINWNLEIPIGGFWTYHPKLYSNSILRNEYLDDLKKHTYSPGNNDFKIDLISTLNNNSFLKFNPGLFFIER